MNYILLGCGIYLVFVSMINNCKGALNKILLKAIPLLIGLFNVLMFFMLQGYIVIR